MKTAQLDFPGGKRFAFTIFDDTDVATVANVRPIYRLLEELGMRTTKTVWPLRCADTASNFASSETLDDPEYRDFVVDLQRRGFEIASHGATMESSVRDQTLAAMERYKELFGAYPRLHANHSYNRENLYWGVDRLDDRLLRTFYARFNGRRASYYQGHVPGSPYWWGDFATNHVQYVRNLTFENIDLRRVNPSMPYRDPSRPLVQWWFSSADAESVDEFVALLHEPAQSRLQEEGGVCIVATHLGKGYCTNGQVDPRARKVLESLARRPGWFPTTGELLDWLRARRREETLPAGEWRRMQWRWFWDLLSRKIRMRSAPRLLAGK